MYYIVMRMVNGLARYYDGSPEWSTSRWAASWMSYEEAKAVASMHAGSKVHKA